jgi:hypothetical protein
VSGKWNDLHHSPLTYSPLTTQAKRTIVPVATIGQRLQDLVSRDWARQIGCSN